MFKDNERFHKDEKDTKFFPFYYIHNLFSPLLYTLY